MTKRLDYKISFRLSSEVWKALQNESEAFKEEIGSTARKLLTSALLRSEIKSDLTKLLDNQNVEFQSFKDHLEGFLLKQNIETHTQVLLRVFRKNSRQLKRLRPTMENFFVTLSSNVLGALESLRELLVGIAERQESLISILDQLCSVISERQRENPEGNR